jgi:hypothetical protein
MSSTVMIVRAASSWPSWPSLQKRIVQIVWATVRRYRPPGPFTEKRHNVTEHTLTHEDVDAATVLFTLSFPPQPRELDLAGEEADEARGEGYPLVSPQGADAEADRAEGRRHLLPTNQT